MERGTWRATVCGVTELDTTEQLSTHVWSARRSRLVRTFYLIKISRYISYNPAILLLIRAPPPSCPSSGPQRGLYTSVCCCFCAALSHIWLFATPWSVAHQVPLSIEFSRQEILKWVAIFFSRGSSQPNALTYVSSSSCISRWILSTMRHLGSPRKLSAAAAAKSLQSCPTLCNPIDRSPPDFPVPGILQARALVAISFFNA